MTIRHGDGNLTPARDSLTNTVRRRVHVDIGASGAATVFGDANITVVKNTTGVYDVTFPPIADYTLTSPQLFVDVQKSAVPTVAGCVVTAVDFAAGTARFSTFLATPGTPVQPASGDKLVLEITAGGYGVR